MMQSLQDFEGLIFSTAIRYHAGLGMDLEDLQQLLRIKVWKVADKFEPGRVRQRQRSDGRSAHQAYVNMCLQNYLKDLLQARDRERVMKDGKKARLEPIDHLLSDDGRERDPRFELRYFSVCAEDVYGSVGEEAVALPSTLTELERCVVGMRMLDYSMVEISRSLDITYESVKTAMSSIREKMADWRPSTRREVVARDELPLAA